MFVLFTFSVQSLIFVSVVMCRLIKPGDEPGTGDNNEPPSGICVPGAGRVVSAAGRDGFCCVLGEGAGGRVVPTGATSSFTRPEGDGGCRAMSLAGEEMDGDKSGEGEGRGRGLAGAERRVGMSAISSVRR